MVFLGKLSTAGGELGKVILYHLFFFVPAADLLQSILNFEKSLGNLQLPINLDYTADFPILQYADDTLIFMEGDVSQLSNLKTSYKPSLRLLDLKSIIPNLC